MPEAYVRWYLVQIVSGLKHANSVDILHQDLKPDNILVTSDGSIKLADLGVSSILGTSDDTQVMLKVGTLCYSSPEQILKA